MAATDVRQVTETSLSPGSGEAVGRRGAVMGGLALTIVATVAAFPFEPAGAHEWMGSLFILGALALMTANMLLAVEAVRAGRDLAAAGFGAVALYGFGTTLDASLLARGLPEMNVAVLPAMWAVLALGLLLVGFGDRFPVWVRIVGMVSAVGHLVAAVVVLFGAEMPPTGADSTAWQSLLVAGSKLLFLVTLVGWAIAATHLPRARPATPGGG